MDEEDEDVATEELAVDWNDPDAVRAELLRLRTELAKEKAKENVLYSR